MPKEYLKWGQESFLKNPLQFSNHELSYHLAVYRMSQKEKSVFCEVIVSVILGKKLCMYMCPIPNGFRDTAISLYRRATRHVLTRILKCIDVDGGIFQNVLY
jgi:hypothetical protein